ncbi:hypothetical protein Aph02nite_48570 [Actinoplanes philippinensis]|uniref:Uncharacterized protein n=1 Tax=Actinoplanes philippinensis TaxID=35752 RepID=A0A1I2HYA3_9ACTN|nr:hypothetical protein [Actinoplanes philippinensis]GIE78907.1 hypothetical protein Aph02nite_48570 [Actinoplanes philippinensis]SFF34320.1 hypothetical protein SAMN05421541_10930 [Actinoplanes philippinensis]
MFEQALAVTAATTIALLVLTEIAAAVLPMVIVLLFVPPHERDGLARLLAACDSSRRLRLWPALRAAVRARRRATGHARP